MCGVFLRPNFKITTLNTSANFTKFYLNSSKQGLVIVIRLYQYRYRDTKWGEGLPPPCNSKLILVQVQGLYYYNDITFILSLVLRLKTKTLTKELLLIAFIYSPNSINAEIITQTIITKSIIILFFFFIQISNNRAIVMENYFEASVRFKNRRRGRN